MDDHDSAIGRGQGMSVVQKDMGSTNHYLGTMSQHFLFFFLFSSCVDRAMS